MFFFVYTYIIGQYIIKQGDPADNLYLILDGVVEVIKVFFLFF
jgi:signal-transduction protein with cAMP-binding, CBS, and nucleotidyltransferase domain